MPRLDPMPDTCRTAADVRATSRAVFERRRVAYEKLAAAPRAEPELLAERPAVNPPPPWRPIYSEVSRQLGIPSDWLKKGTESRGMPTAAYRQLAMALMCRLTKLSLNTIARLFDINDHSTVIHARNAMQPILDAAGLTEADSVPVWVEATLPLLFVHLAAYRAKNRAHGAAMHGANGKFAHICGRSETANGRRS
jgi:hypothetical protein